MLIGITGAKGSGKDTFAQPFVNFGAKNVKMAGPLKDMLRTLYRGAGLDQAAIEQRIEGDLKEVPCVVLGGATPRYAMQTLGTEWRDMLDQRLWTKIWTSKVQQLLAEGHDVICTDVRFHHEWEAIKALGGIVVRVDRPGLTSGDFHKSETEMNELAADYLVTNERGIGLLHDKAMQLRKELMQ